jgi:hypothetical protein
MRFYVWLWHHWCTGYSIGVSRKKLTRAEKTSIRVTTRVSILGPKDRAHPETLHVPVTASSRAPFVPLDISGLGHVSGSEMLTLVVTLVAVFSACVSRIRMASFAPIWNRRCTVYAKETG